MAIWTVPKIGSPGSFPPYDPRWRLHSEGRIQAEETGAIWEPEAGVSSWKPWDRIYTYGTYIWMILLYTIVIYIYNTSIIYHISIYIYAAPCCWFFSEVRLQVNPQEPYHFTFTGPSAHLDGQVWWVQSSFRLGFTHHLGKIRFIPNSNINRFWDDSPSIRHHVVMAPLPGHSQPQD